MNFCRRNYQPILRYLYTKTIKRGGEISLHKHFNEGNTKEIMSVKESVYLIQISIYLHKL